MHWIFFVVVNIEMSWRVFLTNFWHFLHYWHVPRAIHIFMTFFRFFSFEVVIFFYIFKILWTSSIYFYIYLTSHVFLACYIWHLFACIFPRFLVIVWKYLTFIYTFLAYFSDTPPLSFWHPWTYFSHTPWYIAVLTQFVIL